MEWRECSTPDGIDDRDGRLDARVRETDIDVLNA